MGAATAKEATAASAKKEVANILWMLVGVVVVKSECWRVIVLDWKSSERSSFECEGVGGLVVVVVVREMSEWMRGKKDSPSISLYTFWIDLTFFWGGVELILRAGRRTGRRAEGEVCDVGKNECAVWVVLE